jgi:hypothetical protein
MARPRVRRCVECPKCLTRYLVAFSPYLNGSYLVPVVFGCSNEYTLHCSCSRPSFASRWRWSEMKVCEVSKRAHDRGYGTASEIVPENYRPTHGWPFDIARYLNLRTTEKGTLSTKQL